MHPVLAEQEIQMITLRRRHLQTAGERDKGFPKRSLRLNRSFRVDVPLLKGMRAWVRAAVVVGSRSTAKAGENAAEAVV